MLQRLATSVLLSSLLTLGAFAGPAAPTGKWLAEDIDGGGVIDRLQTTLELRADGMVSGMGGCNRYAGSAQIDGDAIKFLPMGSTRMACSPAIMKQESKFHATLEKVTAWRVDEPKGKLVLLDKGGFVVMVLAGMK